MREVEGNEKRKTMRHRVQKGKTPKAVRRERANDIARALAGWTLGAMDDGPGC